MDIDAMVTQLRQLREKVDALVAHVFPDGLPKAEEPPHGAEHPMAETEVTAAEAETEVEEVEEHDEATGEPTRRVRRKRT